MADTKVEVPAMADTNVEVSAKADTDVEVSAMADTKVEEAAMADTNVEAVAMGETNVEVAAMADTDVEEIAAMADTNVEMASAARTDVFGEAITQELLMEIPEFANRARKDRSDVAKQWKNKDGKYDEVVRYVRQLKAQWGTGVSTLCMVYNGTGEPLRFVTSNDWFGQIYLTYPRVIANGQWGGFLHVKRTAVASGSQAAAVYRGKNKDGEDTDFMVAWDNPWNRARFDNNVYAEINRAGYFDRINWGSIANSMIGVGLQYTAEWRGCMAYVKTESDTSPLFEAVLSLE